MLQAASFSPLAPPAMHLSRTCPWLMDTVVGPKDGSWKRRKQKREVVQMMFAALVWAVRLGLTQVPFLANCEERKGSKSVLAV